MKREKMIKQAAIRYIGRDYDKAELEKLLNGSEQPHPVHEEPLIKTFIAGANWADKNPKDEDQAKRKYRMEVAELAKQLLPDCSFDIREAFRQAEKFMLSKYSYILTGDIKR